MHSNTHQPAVANGTDVTSDVDEVGLLQLPIVNHPHAASLFRHEDAAIGGKGKRCGIFQTINNQFLGKARRQRDGRRTCPQRVDRQQRCKDE